MNWNDEFNRFVGHYSKYQDLSGRDQPAENFIKFIDADIGRKVDFNRIAVHHMVIPAYSRSSSPHAESHEEEFVLVLQGQIDLWLNGFIYPLKEGHAVGFPAGTGISHTFINNSDQDVQLIVAGEKTKDENLCYFPINLEFKETCGIWWENAPRHQLGFHDGKPKKVKNDELGKDKPGCVVYCPEVRIGESFHYPSDNETFGEGFRITDKVGLKALGVNYEHLPPGRRSAFPHAHTHEEEFVFVIKGKPTLWMNGYTKTLEEGCFAAFPSNTGISHAIINETEEPVEYLCIGETADFPDEKIIYPFNPLRNKECDRKGWFWKDAPKVEFGKHNGQSKIPFQGHLKLRLVTKENVDEVHQICKDFPQYFIKVEGCEPTKEMTFKEIVEKPKEQSQQYFKEFLIIEAEGQAVGVVDLHVNHPEQETCYIGLLLLKESLQRKRLGTRAYKFIENYIKTALSCEKIKLGVSEENDVSIFWQKFGFKPSGKTYNWHGEKKTAKVMEFQKSLN